VSDLDVNKRRLELSERLITFGMFVSEAQVAHAPRTVLTRAALCRRRASSAMMPPEKVSAD
jgi:hypothetical protein